MSPNYGATVLLGLLAGATACDPARDEGLTEPDPDRIPLVHDVVPNATTVFYTTTYLTNVGGLAYDVNNKGQVVGFYPTSSGSKAFIWEKGVRKDIGTLGGNNSVAYAINDAGQIVGESSLPGETDIHAFLWSKGVMKDLGTLGFTGTPFFASSQAFGINAKGNVVGWSLTAGGATRAFRYDGTKMSRLMGMESMTARAYAIDSIGRIVGHLGDPTTPRAFRWQAGVLTKLGTLGGATSQALAINNAGKIVGWSTSAAGATRAFLWQNGVMTDLGTLGGPSATANAINKSGQVAGATKTASGEDHAFVWKNGVMSDVAFRGAGWGINDSGWVVGGRVDPFVSPNGSLGFLPTVWRPTSTPPTPPPPGVVGLGSKFFVSKRNLSIPAVDTIPVGKTVTWTWLNSTDHNVTSTGSPSFPSSAGMRPKGSQYTVTFTKAGTYSYRCTIHKPMTGVVVVR
jgi:probable HAF family extracellular repeat protein